MTLATNKQKATLHILKSKYGLSERQYRDFLIENFNGIDSSLGLSEEQADYCIHLMNYAYNEDYKRGFNKAIEYNASNLLDQFKFKIEMKYERMVTEVEIQMFNSLDKEQQIEMIEKI